MGIKLADQMLADHVKQHGKYPEKVSFVIWGDETMRHEACSSRRSSICLERSRCGTRAARSWTSRSSRGQARPAPRGHRHRVGGRGHVQQRDAADGQGVQKVKALDEAENYVRSTISTKAILVQRLHRRRGRSPRRRAHLRRAARHVQPEHLDHRRRERHVGVGQGLGQRLPPQAGARLRERVLGRVDGGRLPAGAVGHREDRAQQSTMLYGALDNDDMFMYMGGWPAPSAASTAPTRVPSSSSRTRAIPASRR